MNLSDLHTTTTVEWSDHLDTDCLTINGSQADNKASMRVSTHLDLIRNRIGLTQFANVDSANNFPMGTGIASSASSFAALTMAAIYAAKATASERELSILARCGSGSASRSIPSGFSEWYYGETHESSYAETFVDHDHWDLVDVIAIISKSHKKTGSTQGHPTADSSILQPARVQSADTRLQLVKESIKDRDFVKFADTVEEDSNLMHAVMMTSRPPLFYWQPMSIEVMNAVRDWREHDGLQVCYTLDAGPNVHCICVRTDADKVKARLESLSDKIEIRESGVGRGTYLVE